VGKNHRIKEQLTENGEPPEQIFKGRKVLTSFPILDRLVLDQAIAIHAANNPASSEPIEIHWIFTTA